MTVKDLQQFKFARSPMYNDVVQIERVREDENGQPIIDGMVGGKTRLFRASELTDFRSWEESELDERWKACLDAEAEDRHGNHLPEYFV